MRRCFDDDDAIESLLESDFKKLQTITDKLMEKAEAVARAEDAGGSVVDYTALCEALRTTKVPDLVKLKGLL